MRIGAFEVHDELGRGGVGVVYRARSPTGEEVALKLLLRLDEDRLARFGRERRLLGSFNEREGFVPLLESGTCPQGPYLVMPLVTGGTLRARIERGPLGIEETIALGRDLARAIAIAHERGIVHRDLKPENVLFHEGRPLVADLGLAKHFLADTPYASRSVALTRSGEIRGTPGYLAPEQVNDSRSVGPATNVFAIGAILYECLAGRPAFDGATLVEVLTNLGSGKREPLARARPEAPAWLVSVIDKALAIDVRDRFADGRVLRDALGKTAPARSGHPGLALLLAAVAFTGLATVFAWHRQKAPDSSRAQVPDVPRPPEPAKTNPYEEAFALPTLDERIRRLEALGGSRRLPDDPRLREAIAAAWLEQAGQLDVAYRQQWKEMSHFLFDGLARSTETKSSRDLRVRQEQVIHAFDEYLAASPSPDLMADEVAFTLTAIQMLSRNPTYAMLRGDDWAGRWQRAFAHRRDHPTLCFIRAHEILNHLPANAFAPPEVIAEAHTARLQLEGTKRRPHTRVLAYNVAVDILRLYETKEQDLMALFQYARYREENSPNVNLVLDPMHVDPEPMPDALVLPEVFFGWIK